MSLIYTIKPFSEKTITQLINIDISETVESWCRQFQVIFQVPGSSYYPITLSVGVDAMVFVKSWKIIELYGASLGSIHSIHLLYVKGNPDKESIAMLKE